MKLEYSSRQIAALHLKDDLNKLVCSLSTQWLSETLEVVIDGHELQFTNELIQDLSSITTLDTVDELISIILEAADAAYD